MATDSLGLYVHIPYCVRKCNYCDFCSLPNGRGEVPKEYINALCDEISSYKGKVCRSLDTVYFGGGTPSLLTSEQISEIMSVLRSSFEISDGAELTFEANPGTVNQDNAQAFKSAGFNRASLGLQSIHENEMKKLGRIHNFQDFLKTYSLLRSSGFDNINVDLMYGIPYQTKDSFRQTLEKVIELSPEHISSYGLIIEEGTPFYSEKDSLLIPTQDDECDMYDLACKILANAGYEHYEISNYAKAGRRSRHNLLYWNFKDYIGVGAAAHSFLSGKRFYNTSDVSEYIRGSSLHCYEENDADSAYEYAMLKLRLKDGFLLSEYESRFGTHFLSGKEDVIDALVKAGLIIIDNGRISLTERGFYVSNSILTEIL